MLFTPLRIGTFEVAEPDHAGGALQAVLRPLRVRPRETAYFVRRARGRVRALRRRQPPGAPSGSIRNFEDAFDPRSVDANQRLTDAVHEAGVAHRRAAQPPRRPDPAGRTGRVRGRRTHPRASSRRPRATRRPRPTHRDIAGLVGGMGAQRRARAARRLRRRRGAPRARLPAAPVPVAALQPADRRVRRRPRGPHPVPARGAARGAVQRGRRLHRRRSGSSRTSSTLRGSTAAGARGDRRAAVEARLDFLDLGAGRLPQRALRLPVVGRCRRVAARRRRRGQGGEPRRPGLRRRARPPRSRRPPRWSTRASPTWSR